jgi:hypothetical protein
MYFENPRMKVEGLVIGERISNYYDEFTVTYETHNIVGQVRFDVKPKKLLGIFSRSSNLPTDHFQVSIT